ncbi:glycoside hydrolase family 25 protein (plasmid) [Nocardia sp. CA-151230]|uniref:glycoside hydrolase family 25 protein n=1 Tax=Nocardia sp. CA-151230 TaxID=3239982 RepID=UPI003D8F051A
MTLYGIDISNNNGSDIDLAQVKAEGFDFVFCKVSEGDYFVDSTWPAYRDAARAAGLALAGYHYVRGDCDPDSQADVFVRHLDGAAAMLDFEANSGGMDVFWAVVRAINARGVQVALSYIPRWYWQQIGSPDLSQAPGLIQSSYVTTPSAPASAMYPGDDSAFWNGFGGKAVDILQFTDGAMVAGHSVDANAFRGTRADLDTLLAVPRSPNPATPGADMALDDNEQRELLDSIRYIRGQLSPWPQLGHNEQGQPLTLVDAVAQLRKDLGK